MGTEIVLAYTFGVIAGLVLGLIIAGSRQHRLDYVYTKRQHARNEAYRALHRRLHGEDRP